MSTRLTCEQARDLAPELAVGVISGDDRAQLLAHTSSCAACRRHVEKLSETADSLLLLAPEHEPPAGFESEVLRQIRTPAVERRGRLLWAAAAVVLAAVMAAGAALWTTHEERELGTHYQHALDEADGDYFGVRRLETLNGEKVGNVFLYTGHTDWAFVVFHEGVARGDYRAELKMKQAGVVNLGEFDLVGAEQTWGRDIKADMKEATALWFRGPDGEVLVARFH